jgi:starch-binding outer membrane protein, SusD/RagB family
MSTAKPEIPVKGTSPIFFNLNDRKRMKKEFSLLIFHTLQLTYILLAALSLSACTKLFESHPQNQETIESFLGDPATAEANFEKLMKICYNVFYMSELSWEGNTHHGDWMPGDWLSDDCQKGGDGPADLPEVLSWRTWNDIPSDYDHANGTWKQAYLGIARTNSILVYLDTYYRNISDASYRRLKGEALFIRAYYYFNLAKVYGSVPYFESPFTADDYSAPPKMGPEELYAHIEHDLTLAATLLPVKSKWSDFNIIPDGRATKGSVQAILARVISMEIGFQFNEKTWQDVYNVTDSIIQSDEYALISNYAVIFETGGEQCSESVFEINCYDSAQGYGAPGGNLQPIMVQYRFDPTLNAYKHLTGNGYFGGTGWGFSCPTQNLFDEFEPGDVRRACTIIKDGDILWEDGVPMTDERINVKVTTTCPTGYWFKKYAYSVDEKPSGNTNSGKNMRKCRYAEILLLHAEAAYHTGREAEALQYLNEVHERARNSTPPKGSEWMNTGYPEAPHTLGPITATSGEELLIAIKHERRVELAIEGNRAWDLIRWGEYEDAIRQYIPEDYVLKDIDPEEVIANYRSHLIDGIVPCLPIPASEAEAYDIQQNPGY